MGDDPRYGISSERIYMRRVHQPGETIRHETGADWHLVAIEESVRLTSVIERPDRYSWSYSVQVESVPGPLGRGIVGPYRDVRKFGYLAKESLSDLPPALAAHLLGPVELVKFCHKLDRSELRRIRRDGG